MFSKDRKCKCDAVQCWAVGYIFKSFITMFFTIMLIVCSARQSPEEEKLEGQSRVQNTWE